MSHYAESNNVSTRSTKYYLSLKNSSTLIGDYFRANINTLSSIPRFSGVNSIKSESVMEHIGMTGILAWILVKRIQSSLDKENSGVKIDIGRVLEAVVVHDLDEIITGDIPRPTKYFSSSVKEALDRVAEVGIEKLTEILDISDLPRLWSAAKDPQTAEGLIVHAADILSVIVKAVVEWGILNNNDFEIILSEVRYYLESSMIPRYKDNFTTMVESSQLDGEDQDYYLKMTTTYRILIEEFVEVLRLFPDDLQASPRI